MKTINKLYKKPLLGRGWRGKTLWVVLAMMIALTAISCKKSDDGDPKEPEEDHSAVPVTAADLTSLLGVLEMSGEVHNSTLYIMEFKSVGGGGVQLNNIRTGTNSSPNIQVFKDNVLSYIAGPFEFKYKFARHKNGDIYLENANVYRIGEETVVPDAYVVVHSQLYKKTELLDFTQKVFKQSAEASYLSFQSNGDWKWSVTNNFDAAPTRKYEKIANGNSAFQTPDFSPKHIGIYVPQWKNINKPVLLVQNNSLPKSILQFEEVK